MVLAGLLHAAFCERRRQQVAAEAAAEKSIASTAESISASEANKPGGAISIYYGTQTGTAESFARDIERELQNRFVVHVVDLEDVKSLESLADRSIFLTATYGEGESPDNAALFCNWIEHATGLGILTDVSEADAGNNATKLKSMEYAVFGLGNKQYDHFNAMGKYFDRAFELLGATRIAALGLGDDDDDIEADFETWREQALFPALEKYADGAVVASNGTMKTIPECPIIVKFHEDGLVRPTLKIKAHEMHSSSRHFFDAVEAKVTAVRTLRSPKDPGQTLHMELSGGRLKYSTADNLGVQPINDATKVHRLAKALGMDDHTLESSISIQPNENSEWHGVKFPQPDTVFNILSNYYDIQAPPRRADLGALADFCTNKVDRDFLLRLSSKDGRDEYKTKILGEYTGWVEIAERLPSLNVPLAHLLNLLPPMQQRFYTIASSSSLHPNSIHLTVALTQHQRPHDNSVFKGVCTRYLSDTPMNEFVRVTLRPSTFRLPKSPSTPIILIGPGTGIAPMRAFLQERSFQKKKQRAQLGTTILYFGCKRPDMDYIYHDELVDFQADGVLHHLRVAFSREQKTKVYVQHLLQQHAEETWDLIDRQGAYVYVCGGVQMGNDVSETLGAIVAQSSSINAKEYLARMSQAGRYVQELWA